MLKSITSLKVTLADNCYAKFCLLQDIIGQKTKAGCKNFLYKILNLYFDSHYYLYFGKLREHSDQGNIFWNIKTMWLTVFLKRGWGRRLNKLMSVHGKGVLPKWNKWKQVKGGSKFWAFFENVIIECPPSWIILTFAFLITIVSQTVFWN